MPRTEAQKACTAAWQAAHPERQRELVRRAQRTYRVTERGRALTRKYHDAQPTTVIRARLAVSRALVSGQLVKEPCIDCGRPDSQAHHPNGYEADRQLDIQWLCPVDHAARHPRRRTNP